MTAPPTRGLSRSRSAPPSRAVPVACAPPVVRVAGRHVLRSAVGAGCRAGHRLRGLLWRKADDSCSCSCSCVLRGRANRAMGRAGGRRRSSSIQSARRVGRVVGWRIIIIIHSFITGE
ncbi:hypothetical protein SEVIR_3G023451v4 [Setaria viridis]